LEEICLGIGSLESWLKSRRKVQAISMVREHSKVTMMAIEQLQRCISFAIQGERDELIKAFNILQQKEREADVLRRRIIDELVKGDLPATEREDLMRLAREIDWVIDWAHETGRILVEFNLQKMPEGIRGIAQEMVGVIGKCASKLDDCIEKLTNKSFPEALKAADEVEAFEEEVDRLYQRARGMINSLDDGRVPVGTAILLAQFMDALENTADRCEHTCDEVRVIAVTMLR
jgi:predicted phosphate transport protein (TIGR00153 family)